MRRLFKRKSKFNIMINNEFSIDGVYISIEKNNEVVDLPIKLTITEMLQLDNLDEIQLIEELHEEEKLTLHDSGKYMLSYQDIYALNEEERGILNLPENMTPITIELDNKSFIGDEQFQFVTKMHSEEIGNLHLVGKRKGAIIELPTGNYLLLEEDAYRFLETVDKNPSNKNIEALTKYVAKVKNEAENLGIKINEYLKNENYEFIDYVNIDVQRTNDNIEFLPTYEHEALGKDILDDIGRTEKTYNKYGKKRVFVDEKTIDTKNKIIQMESIPNKDIPTFVQNPTAYIPEEVEEMISLEDFSDRVKSLDIRVYKAQPFIHANKDERGWFDYDIGFHVKDNEGNEISRQTEDFFNESDDVFKQLDENTFIEVPNDYKEFQDLSSKAKEEARSNKSTEPSLSNYVLEIFQNISHVEYNQPLIEIRESLKDEEVFSLQPPATFQATLKPFQEDGFKWMKTLRFTGNGGLLADDMGLGKTIQVIAYLTYLREQGRLTPTLLVLPKSLIQNWVNELKKFAPILTNNLYVHTGSNRVRNHETINQYDIVLTTYHTLSRDQTILGRIDWEMVILDEAQHIKNPTTTNSIVVKALKNNGRLALTGTPVENNLTELWSIIDFVQPGTLGSLKDFKAKYEKQLEDENLYGEIQQSIEEKMKYIYLRRTKKGELEDQLPTKTELPPIHIPMGRQQEELYKGIIKQVQNKQMTGLQAIQRLKSLCSHPGLLDSSLKSIKTNQIPKLKKTMDILKNIQSKNEKVIIFTEYRTMQTILKKEILETFHMDAAIINGTTNKRQEVVDEFNKSEGFGVLILSPKAAGTGLTITSANHVIHYTRWWNPAVENQATDRVYRIGQEKDVYVYYPIVTSNQSNKTVEEIIDELIRQKKSLAENVIVPSKGDSIEKELMAEMAPVLHA